MEQYLMETEILSDEELTELTGYKARAYQRRWLIDRQWVFVESRGKRPLVGRMYARMKLACLAPLLPIRIRRRPRRCGRQTIRR